MIKKVLFIIALGLSLQLITGCCDCDPIRKIYFSKKGLSLKNLDATLPLPGITNDSIISSAKYGIHIQLLTTQLALDKKKIKWGLIQSAQACKCASDDFIPKENILSVAIFSNNDFDAIHPKNTDLSLYFKAKRNSSFVSIIDYLKLVKDVGYRGNLPFFEGIFLQTAPNLIKKHKFRVKITLSDGRILEAETNEVELI